MAAVHNHSHFPAFLNTVWAKAFIVAVILISCVVPSDIGGIVFHVLVESYLTVAVFVALTLILIYGAENIFNFDLGKYNRAHPRAQVWISSLLGAMPGCGGAIIVLTQYVNGYISFGSVVAVLIATMGDAAFLLLAKKPLMALVVMAVSVVAAIITGIIVDRLHGRDFMKVKIKPKEVYHSKTVKVPSQHTRDIIRFLTFIIMFPGVIAGMLMAFRFDVPHEVQDIIGGIGIFFLLIVWVLLKDQNPLVNYAVETSKTNLVRRTTDETAFIIIWVILAFFLYDLTVEVFDIQLENIFSSVAWLMPLTGVLIGFIPGCGPQIIVTTLYINGIVPFSAQLGNAISNDGDALFPAIALAPKAALLATLYSAVPAVIIAYAYFWIFE